MPERRIGFIPNVVVPGESTSGIFVTDQRTIRVRDEAPMGFKASLKASFAAEADMPTAPRRSIDYVAIDIDTLAKMDGNLSIPHMSIEKLAVGKGIGGYGIWMEYMSEGKKNYLAVSLEPPPELTRKRKAEGVSAKETRRQYAIRSQEVFRRALPPIISEKVDWRI